jgi:uncharacterized protein YcfL
MWGKSKFFSKAALLILLSTLSAGFFSCATPQQNPNQNVEISSPKPVSIFIAKGLQGQLFVKSVTVRNIKGNTVIQFSVVNEGYNPITFLYKVDVYDINGLLINYPTLRWVSAQIEPQEERIFKVVIPYKLSQIDKITVKLRQPAN